MSKIDRYKILIRKMIQLGIVASQKDLGRKLGYSNESSFSQIINQKVAEPKDFVERIKSLYPELNTDWLLYGEGEMNGTAIVPAEVVEEIKEEVAQEVAIAESVPILSEDLTTATDINIRSYLEENGDELERINPSQMLQQADLAEKVMRVSMLPTFAPGDIVTTRDDIVSVAKIVGLLRMTFTDFYSDIDEARKQKEAQISNMIESHTTQVDSLIKEISKIGERENRLIDILEKKL